MGFYYKRKKTGIVRPLILVLATMGTFGFSTHTLVSKGPSLARSLETLTETTGTSLGNPTENSCPTDSPSQRNLVNIGVIKDDSISVADYSLLLVKQLKLSPPLGAQIKDILADTIIGLTQCPEHNGVIDRHRTYEILARWLSYNAIKKTLLSPEERNQYDLAKGANASILLQEKTPEYFAMLGHLEQIEKRYAEADSAMAKILPSVTLRDGSKERLPLPMEARIKARETFHVLKGLLERSGIEPATYAPFVEERAGKYR